MIAFVLLKKNKHNLQSIKFRKYFFILYQGLKPERYYWEFINTLRKISIFGINSLFVTLSINYKLLASVVLMVSLIRIQNALKPYKRSENNEIELLGIIAGTVTLYCGIIFSLQDERYSAFVTICTILIFTVNAHFLIQFSYLLALSLECSNEYYK